MNLIEANKTRWSTCRVQTSLAVISLPLYCPLYEVMSIWSIRNLGLQQFALLILSLNYLGFWQLDKCINEYRDLVTGSPQSFWIITCTLIRTTIMAGKGFCAHLLIYKDPDCHHLLVLGNTLDPSIKFHCNLFITFWVMLLTDRQTNKQTNQHYQNHNLLCQGCK